jgi:hypothetical protein
VGHRSHKNVPIDGTDGWDVGMMGAFFMSHKYLKFKKKDSKRRNRANRYAQDI